MKRLLIAALSALILAPAHAAPPKRAIAAVPAPLPDVVRVALATDAISTTRTHR